MMEDYEREHLKDIMYMQADEAIVQKQIMKEIMEEEHKRLPAKIKVVYENIKQLQPDELEDNALSF